MIFGAPLFLTLLPAAGLPVLFHFILKQRKREILFPTLMFFYRTDPRLNARRKIHQWMLLLMRVLLILCLLLALSRPRFQGGATLGGKISGVILVDNSGSMTADAGNGKTKLELAVAGARDLVLSLGGHAKMGVVTLVQDPAVLPGPALTFDEDTVFSALGKITPTAATGDARLAMMQAFKLLEEDRAAAGVIHIFTDCQAVEWGNDLVPVDARTPDTKLFVHRIPSPARAEANVAVSAIQFPHQKILPKHPLTIGVLCRNNSSALATVRFNSVDDQDRKNTEQLVLEAGRTHTAEVTLRPDRQGVHWIRTWIEGDGFSADNEAGIGVVCAKTATVLFAGAQDEFGVLPAAFSPDGLGQFTGMTLSFGAAGTLAQTEDDRPILMVTTWEGIRRLGVDDAQVRAYVEGGGNLLVVPSVRRISARGAAPDWLGADTGTRRSHAGGVSMAALDTDAQFWVRIRQAAGTADMAGSRVLTSYALTLSNTFTPLMGTESGQVLLAHKTLGLGNIYVSGSAFDPRWNTLSLSGWVVVMAQVMAVEGTSLERDGMVQLVAGDAPEPINRGSGQVEVVSLMGDGAQWTGPANQLPAFSNAGAYLVKLEDREFCVSVRASDREGMMEFVDESVMPVLNRMTHEVVPYDPEASLDRYRHGSGRMVDLFLPLLLLATVALFVEGWLANPRRAGCEDATAVADTAQPIGRSPLPTPGPEVIAGGGAG